jgi:general secretion pathway protein G
MTKFNFRQIIQNVKSTSGFTMIELLVVTTIIILLTTIGLISYSQALQNSRNAKRKSDLEVIRQALVLFKADNGYYPSTDYDGLQAVLGTGYLSAIPTDPKSAQSATFTYSYVPGTCSGVSPVKCQTFDLGASLESGSSTTDYSIANP